MTGTGQPEASGTALPEAEIRTRRRFSMVWVIPLVAILIGGWLVYQALSEQGPTIAIRFPSAEGIVVGKTKIKYKDVEVGRVDSMVLNQDLSEVVVTVSMAREMEPHLTASTRFWVVSARVAAGQVSGLSTLLSGVYIGMDPGEAGRPERHFQGLRAPPIVTSRSHGRQFLLRSRQLGSLDIGAPLYYRNIRVGKVASYELDPKGEGVKITVFVDTPFDALVHEQTRFWNVSGIDASLTAEGIEVDIESLLALFIGGIAFDDPDDLDAGGPVAEGRAFALFASRKAANEKVYTRTQRYLLYFSGSVRGLSVGAPVEFRGMPLGQVLDFSLEADLRTMEFRIPVLIEVEPDRIRVAPSAESRRSAGEQEIQALVDKGLRAQLKTGNLLTGQLVVDLDFYPDAPRVDLHEEAGYLVFPTVPSTLDTLRSSATQLLAKLERLPLEEIANELRGTLQGTNRIANAPEWLEALDNLNQALVKTRHLMTQLDREVAPEMRSTLSQATQSLVKIQKNIVDADAPVYHDLTRMLRELAQAAHSIRMLASYLERHPEALIQGKGGR